VWLALALLTWDAWRAARRVARARQALRVDAPAPAAVDV
jgi:chloramphenicol-sensitive protein RarD